MLEKFSLAVLHELATTTGKSVTHVDLFEVPPFSLIQVTTESGSIYVIETLDTSERNGHGINIGNPETDSVSPSQIKNGVLTVGKPLEYVFRGKSFTTKPLKMIRLLAT